MDDLDLGAGRPLSPALRRDLEPQFETNLAHIRVHDDARANFAARRVGANAFALGNDLVFAEHQGHELATIDRRLLSHEIAHATSGEDANTIFRDAAPSNLVGLAIPVSPDALTGIHAWEARFAVPFKASSTNKFYVGAQLVAQQICTFDSTGAPHVYMYFARSRDGSGQWAVGPDSLMAFVMTHGGTIVAAEGNTDAPTVRTDAEIDATSLPAAPDAYRGDSPFYGPTIAYVAGKLPAYDVLGHQFVVDNFYVMKPYLRRLPNGSHGVLFYVAHNMHSLMRPEYVVPPHAFSLFKEKARWFGAIAFISYPMTPGAAPPDFRVHSARFALGTVAGDPERRAEFGTMLASAAKSPQFWVEMLLGVASRAEIPAKGPPSLRLLEGGRSSTAPSFTSSMPSTPTVVSNAPATRGATALATETAPAVAPAAAPTPSPKPVGVPGWNPSPIPAMRPAMTTSNLISSLAGTHVSAQALPSSSTAPPQQQKPPRRVTLHLPAAKAPHLHRYRSLVASRTLFHSVAYQRGDTDQREEWKKQLRPLSRGRLQGSMEYETYKRGTELLREFGYASDAEVDDKVLVPHWSRTEKPRLDTDVDHVIELQLLGPDWHLVPWANTFGNFEVLDASANRSSGNLFRDAIRQERQQQAVYYNDQQWLTSYDLIFDRVEADGGGPTAAARWLGDGEHIDALERLLFGDRPARSR